MNKKLLFIVNVDWFFISHRLPIALAAIKNGYEVHLACGITDKKEYLESLNIHIHPLDISRSGTTIFQELKTLKNIFDIIRKVTPDITHCVTIKPVVYGGIASRVLQVKKRVFSISGLGFVFIAKGFKANLMRTLVKSLYKLALGKNSNIIVQNPDDKNMLLKLNAVDSSQITLIRGSGVDLEQYNYQSSSNSIPVVVMASRLLKDKGVFEYIDACKVLKNKNIDAIFRLYGDIDEGNPASLTSQDIEVVSNDNIVEVHGFSDNIAEVFENSDIVVLPSYREGLPKVLIEAAASGRAVVTTDVPGCRDAIEKDLTGILCKVKDSKTLSQAIEKLLLDKDMRDTMGEEGRELAIKEFDINIVISKHLQIYKEAL